MTNLEQAIQDALNQESNLDRSRAEISAEAALDFFQGAVAEHGDYSYAIWYSKQEAE